MDSCSLIRYGFLKWYRLLDIKYGSVDIPSSPGVYVFRLDRCFGRLQGSSDILYIGHAKNLCERILENHLRGKGGKTTKRIHYYLCKMNYLEYVEVSWITTDSVKDSIGMEKLLLKEYEKDHHELPPWNRAL